MGLNRRGLDLNQRTISAISMHEHMTLQARIRAAWIDLLQRNLGAEGLPGEYYTLSVQDVSGHGEEFELCITFRAGRTYCCSETMCHTGVFYEERWRRLRAALAAHGVEPAKPLVVRICSRIEVGARFHYGKPDAPMIAECDQGPWTLTVHEQSPMVPIYRK
jgi:hypothetical protein